MAGTDAPFLVSADPGSSSKGWAVASCYAEPAAQVHFQDWKTPKLPELISTLCEEARSKPVLLAIDAPIRAFGGLQAPPTLDPQPGRFVDDDDRLSWPFDVNPFSQRPCERALGAVPPLHLQGEAHKALATAIDSLIGNSPRPGKKERLSFVKAHKGISVLGYMGAPHAPVVRTFLKALETSAEATGAVEVSYEAETTEPRWRQSGRITVLESHPAVAMGFYCRYGLGGATVPDCVSKYKGAKKAAGVFEQLGDLVRALLAPSCALPSDSKIESDDHLDALFGLLLLLEIAAGRGDLFGTPRDGYFLIPSAPQSEPEAASFRALWEAADLESRKALS